MSHRIVEGLVWARRGEGPGWKPGRSRGAKAEGLRFERLLAKAFPQGEHGSWWNFLDRNGVGWCQPDLLYVGGKSVLVLEVKLSWVAEGHRQIEELYKPVLEEVFGKPVIGVQVCRRLREGAPKAAGRLVDAVDVARGGGLGLLHWVGGPLGFGR